MSIKLTVRGREEAENVSELTFETPANADTVHDATLDVQMHKIRKSIHNFAEACVVVIHVPACGL